MSKELLERKVIKLLLKKDFYEAYGKSIPRTIFPKELLSILDCLVDAQEKYGTELTIYEAWKLFESSHLLTEASRRFYKYFFY